MRFGLSRPRGRRTTAALVAAALVPLALYASAAPEDLDQLFARLKRSRDPVEARRIELRIWSAWSASGRHDVDSAFSRGLEAMADGNNVRARAAFDEVISLAPTFAEGWNKRATVNYLIGDFDASVADIEHTLALEKRHFGALSGLGMIRLREHDYRSALKAFERALEVYPMLPGAREQVGALRAKLGIRSA